VGYQRAPLLRDERAVTTATRRKHRQYGPVRIKGVAGVRCPNCETFTPAGVWALAHTYETEIEFTCPAIRGNGHKCGHKTTIPKGEL